MMQLGERQFSVHTGDTACIPPGTEYNIVNTGNSELKIIAMSAPPFQENDTVITGDS